MRTTLDIDAGLLTAVMRDAGVKTKTAAVTEALRAYLRMRQRERVKQLSGKLTLVENWQELEREELKEAGSVGESSRAR